MLDDTRIALNKGISIYLKRQDSHDEPVEFEIQKEIGRGGSCIVYEATVFCNGKTRSYRLKEFYPCDTKNTYYDIERNENNELIIGIAVQELFDDKKKIFENGCQKQIEFYECIEDARNNIIYVQDMYIGNNTLYCVMPCDNGSSYDNVKDQTILDTLQTAKALSIALKHYHDRDLLHLDIKPANIFILPETRELIKLFDHDSIIEESSLKDRVVRLSGSKGYMADELQKGEYARIDKRTDIYSIGAIIFERVFGRLVTLEDKNSRALDVPRKSTLFRGVLPEFFDELDVFFNKTCLGTRVRRYKNLQEVINALDNLINLTDIDHTINREIKTLEQLDTDKNIEITHFLFEIFPSIVDYVSDLHRTDIITGEKRNGHPLLITAINPKDIYVDNKDRVWLSKDILKKAVYSKETYIETNDTVNVIEGFSAPELSAKEIDAAEYKIGIQVDTFSLCAVLFWACMGREPKKEDIPLTKDHWNELKLKQKRILSNAILKSIYSILVKGLNEDPNSRYKSCYELFTDLHNLKELHKKQILIKKAKTTGLITFAVFLCIFSGYVLKMNHDLTINNDIMLNENNSAKTLKAAVESINWMSTNIRKEVSKNAFRTINKLNFNLYHHPNDYIEFSEKIQNASFISTDGNVEIVAVSEYGKVFVASYPEKEIQQIGEPLPEGLTPIGFNSEYIICLTPKNEVILYEIQCDKNQERKRKVLRTDADNICVSENREYIAIMSNNTVYIYDKNGNRTDKQYSLKYNCQPYKSDCCNFIYNSDDDAIYLLHSPGVYYRVTSSSDELIDTQFVDFSFSNLKQSVNEVISVSQKNAYKVIINMLNDKIGSNVDGGNGKYEFDVSEEDNIIVGVFGDNRLQIQNLNEIRSLQSKTIWYFNEDIEKIRIVKDDIHSYIVASTQKYIYIWNYYAIQDYSMGMTNLRPSPKIISVTNCSYIGNKYIAVHSQGQYIDIYSISGDKNYSLQTPCSVLELNVSDSKQLIATGMNGDIYVYDNFESEKYLKIKHSCPRQFISPDGQRIGAVDYSTGTVVIFNSSGKKIFEKNMSEYGLKELKFANDSDYCIGYGKKAIVIIKNNHIEDIIDNVEFDTSPTIVDSDIIASIDGILYIWDMYSGEKVSPNKDGINVTLFNKKETGHNGNLICNSNNKYICYPVYTNVQPYFTIVKYSPYSKMNKYKEIYYNYIK